MRTLKLKILTQSHQIPKTTNLDIHKAKALNYYLILQMLIKMTRVVIQVRTSLNPKLYLIRVVMRGRGIVRLLNLLILAAVALARTLILTKIKKTKNGFQKLAIPEAGVAVLHVALLQVPVTGLVEVVVEVTAIDEVKVTARAAVKVSARVLVIVKAKAAVKVKVGVKVSAKVGVKVLAEVGVKVIVGAGAEVYLPIQGRIFACAFTFSLFACIVQRNE